MPTLDADAIIAEENLNDANSAIEKPEGANEQPNDQPNNNEAPADGGEQAPESPAEGEPNDGEQDPKPEGGEEQPTGNEEKPVEPATPGKSATETIQEAKSLIGNLNLTEDKIFDDKGNVKSFREVVPVGAFLASQLDPVTVTDKDGKTHEFMLISDVEKAFPDGFQAKNNIEQMKFEKAIMDNESKFNAAVKTYTDAETRYTEETGAMVNQRSEGERIRNEYTAMAEAGLVPKVGDPNDPKFSESEAVKELDKILGWMEKTNAENAKKGLGQINSLYVAKQLMDTEANKQEKDNKKTEVIQQRNEVASLSNSGTPSGAEEKKAPAPEVPLSRLADEIIASEGLR